jgi:hypothetical protein
MITIVSIIGSWLICTVAAERTAELITTSVIFAPFRQFIARMSLMDEEYAHVMWPTNKTIRGIIKITCRWLSDLISCGWCTSFWTSSFFSAFLPGDYLSLNAGDNAVVKAIALWGFANLYHSVFRLVHNGRVAAIDINLHIADEIVDNSGGINGELREGNGQETASGIEPSAI